MYQSLNLSHADAQVMVDGWAGGTPVVVEGQVVGAIGISGMDQEGEVQLGAMAAELVTRAAKGGQP